MKAIAIAMLCMLAAPLAAQSAPAPSSTGRVIQNYDVQNTVEIGGRFVGVSGNSDMYNTLENLHSGPRLLEQSFTARSLDRHGPMFDELWFSSFGYGGDPQAGTRLRMYKSKAYEFNANYRTDLNYFNDNYLDNPYNTPGGYVVWNQAIHQMSTRRNLGDFRIVILPDSAVRLRIGFSRNVNEGTALSSFHEGTELSLLEDFRSRQDQYQIGADFRLAPHTVLSYDQFYDRNKGDFSFVNNPTGLFYINTGTSGAPVYRQVDIGAIYNSYYGQPCTYTSASPIVTVVNGRNVVKTGTGSTACNMYYDYYRAAPTRASFPVERISLISNESKKLSVHATGGYMAASNKTDYLETAEGFVSRTSERGFYFAGPGNVQQNSRNGDLLFTYHFNDSWSVSNHLRYNRWSIPGQWKMTSASCSAAGTASILSPIAGMGNPYCSQLGAASVSSTVGGSSYTLDNWQQLHSESTVQNTTLLAWEPSHKVGAHAGFRYGKRTVGFEDSTTGLTTSIATTGVGTTAASADTGAATLYSEDDHEKAGIFGLKLQPTDRWMIHAEAELSYIDHPVVAILPGHAQEYKLRTTYQLGKWGTLSGYMSDKLRRNSYFSEDFALAFLNTNPVLSGTGSTPTWVASPVKPVRHQDHSYNYGVSAALRPSEKVTLDFGWNYQDLFATGGTCLPMTLAIVPLGGQISRCPAASTSGSLTDSEGDPYSSYNGVPAVLHYTQTTNSFYVNLLMQPVKRLTVLVGYDVTADSGNNLWLRGDTLSPFMVPVDAGGNVIYAGNTLSGTQVGYAYGPNPAVTQGPLALAWHLPSVGVEVGLMKSLTFKGTWRYYDYHEKSDPGLYVIGRDFQANTGTLALRYSF